MEGYTHKEKIQILKQLEVWSKMTKEEQKEFRNCTDEYSADRMMRSLRDKYLNFEARLKKMEGRMNFDAQSIIHDKRI